MAHVEVSDLNQFLSRTPLSVESVDADLDATFSSEIFAKLAARFNVTGWTAVETTPKLVRSILGALIAAQLYENVYAEESEGESWFVRNLRKWAYELLEQVVTGMAVLTEVDPEIDPATLNNPSFYPTDAQETDLMGEERKFGMGLVF